MSYAAENHSTKLLHSFYDAVVRYKLKSNLAWFSDCFGLIKIWMKCMTNIIVEEWKSISIRPQNTCLSFGLTYPISLSEILRSWVFLPFALVRWEILGCIEMQS